MREVGKTFSKKTKLGKRRTTFADAPVHNLDDLNVAFIEREPVTVVLSKKGFLRSLKGHVADLSTLTFKEGDGLKLAFPAQTTDKIVFLSTDGRAYTIGADKLAGGRGQGEPIRLAFELEDAADIALGFVSVANRNRLMVSSDGYGFVVAEGDTLSSTRKGKQLLNLSGTATLVLAPPAEGDAVAVVGENRKMIVFPLIQVPAMVRGKGVRLQRYKEGGLSDLRIFTLADGLTWQGAGGRSFTRTAEELFEWRTDRALAGRLVPNGFPKSNKFG